MFTLNIHKSLENNSNLLSKHKRKHINSRKTRFQDPDAKYMTSRVWVETRPSLISCFLYPINCMTSSDLVVCVCEALWRMKCTQPARLPSCVFSSSFACLSSSKSDRIVCLEHYIVLCLNQLYLKLTLTFKTYNRSSHPSLRPSQAGSEIYNDLVRLGTYISKARVESIHSNVYQCKLKICYNVSTMLFHLSFYE